MIITQNPHGLVADDGDILHDYVFRDELKPPRLIGVFNIIGETPCRAMRAMEMMRDASRASIAFQHITINPKHNLSEQQRDLAVSRILDALGAEDHGYVLVEHFKERSVTDRADHHFHLVLAHVGPDLKALDMSHSFARLEAVARCLEVDFGEELTQTTRPEAVAYFAREMGRDDVADLVLEMHHENGHVVASFEIGSFESGTADRADFDIAGVDIASAKEDANTNTDRSDEETSALPSNGHLQQSRDLSGDEDLRILPESLSRAVNRDDTTDRSKAETLISGDRFTVEMTATIEPACNREMAISPPAEPREVTATTKNAGSERRDDVSIIRAEAATFEASPKPTAATARIRILQRLDAHETRLQDKLLILRTPADEPEKLTMARSVLGAAKKRLQEARTKEEMARNEVAALDGQRPNSLIAKITGKAAKFAACYDEAKRRRVDAMKALQFAQSQFDRSSVAFEAAKKHRDVQQRGIQRERDQEVARIGFELQRIAQTRALLEQHPELALQPRKLAAAVTRSCKRQGIDVGCDVPSYSPRPP